MPSGDGTWGVRLAAILARPSTPPYRLVPAVSGPGTDGPVAAVVVTYQSRDLLAEFVAALPAAAHGVETRLVAVDNASSDGSAEVVEELAPSATVVRLPDNRGYAAGVNAGVAAAPEAGAVLVLNPDIRLGPGVVAHLLAVLREPGVGIAVPRLVDPAGDLLPSLRREPSVRRALGEAVLGGRRAGRHPAWGEMVTDPDAYGQARSADWAVGAAVLVSRECLDAVGPWDESFFLYSEETDFMLRARDLGFTTRYEPKAEAVHVGGEVHTSPRLWAILTVNRVRLYARRHGRAAAVAFRAAVVLNEASRALRGSRVSRAALAALLIPSRRPPEVLGP